MFTTTGDLAMRAEWDDFLATTKQTWERVGVRHEVVDVEAPALTKASLLLS